MADTKWMEYECPACKQLALFAGQVKSGSWTLDRKCRCGAWLTLHFEVQARITVTT